MSDEYDEAEELYGRPRDVTNPSQVQFFLGYPDMLLGTHTPFEHSKYC